MHVKHNIYFTGLIILGLTLLSHTAIAGGPKLRLQAGRNMGMANTGTALALDGSAAWFNPGALGHVERNSVLLGSTYVVPKTSFLGQFPSFYTIDAITDPYTPIYFYSSWRAPKGNKFRPLVFGLAVNNPFQFSTKWPDNWAGNQLSQEFDFSTFSIQPTLAFQLHPRFSIGVGLSYTAGNLLIRKALPENGPDESEASLTYSGSGNGLGINAGIYYQAGKDFYLGMSVRSGTSIGIDKGEARFSVPVSLTEVYPDSFFSTKVPLPTSLNAGISWKPKDRLLIAADLNYHFWNVFDTLHIDFEYEHQNVQDTSFAREFTNSWDLRFGGEYTLNEYVLLRMGLLYETTSVPDGWMSPELPDANRIGLTAGLGVQINQSFLIDLSYYYEYSGERTAVFWKAAFGGTYLSYTFHTGIGLTYQF